MPYPPTKTESYVCTGGINQKVSTYITPDTEFLALQNVDFRTMGALSSFAGSTQYFSGFTYPVTGLAAFFATFTASPQVIGMDEYGVADITSGFSSLTTTLTQVPLGFEQRSLVLSGSSAGLGALFGAGAGDFWTYQGGTNLAWQFSLGKPMRTSVSTTISGGTAGIAGNLIMYYSLVRQDGFVGPSRAVTYMANGATQVSFTMPSQPNTLIGFTGGPTPAPYIPSNVSYGSFGLSGIQVWAQNNQGPIYQYGQLIGLTSGVLNFTIGFGYTGASFFAPGSSYQPTSPGLPYRDPNDFQGAFIYGLGSTQGGIDTSPVSVEGRNPQCIEYYSNRLFSAIGSRVVFSDPGTPEQASYENFFLVAPNEPMSITNMKGYFTQLLIWKFGSTWSLGGNTTDSFNLSCQTTVYGCISKNAACVYEQKCWYLDVKGICEFNGADTAIVSNRVEGYFKRMNVPVAVNTATMIHVKERNEVWTSIPIDGSTYNNLLIIYDYLSNAWSTRTIAGENNSFIAPLTLGAAKPVVYSGGASGTVSTYSSLITGDNGQAFTSIIKSRFITQFGNSIEAMYRRLYLDVTVPQGQTYNFLVNLYADKGASPYYSVTMSVGAFQNRIDFGVPARSLAVELIYSESKFLQVNGFTLESRFQRNC